MATPQERLNEMKDTIRMWKDDEHAEKEFFIVPSGAQLNHMRVNVVEVIGGRQKITTLTLRELHNDTKAFTQLQLTEDIPGHEQFKVGNVVDFRQSTFELTDDDTSLKPFTVVVRKCPGDHQGQTVSGVQLVWFRKPNPEKPDDPYNCQVLTVETQPERDDSGSRIPRLESDGQIQTLNRQSEHRSSDDEIVVGADTTVNGENQSPRTENRTPILDEEHSESQVEPQVDPLASDTHGSASNTTIPRLDGQSSDDEIVVDDDNTVDRENQPPRTENQTPPLGDGRQHSQPQGVVQTDTGGHETPSLDRDQIQTQSSQVVVPADT
eukprot:954042_1